MHHIWLCGFKSAFFVVAFHKGEVCTYIFISISAFYQGVHMHIGVSQMTSAGAVFTNQKGKKNVYFVYINLPNAFLFHKMYDTLASS